MPREKASVREIADTIALRRSKYTEELSEKLYSNLAIPSYVHGYSLAIQYMYNWFESKFEKDFFNSIYVDGKHVLDDYKHFSKMVVKGQNPRARIEPRIEYDYDREFLDTYMAPPELYLKKSNRNESFFKDHDRKLFLALDMKALRMNFNFKIRVSTRAQQLDLYNRILMYFRIGSTMHENLSVDFHIPKDIMLSIADVAGFRIVNNEVVDIIEFLQYLNSHSDIPFLFKIRAINQKAEFFIRLNGLYTHINCIDKPQLDDGERQGKLDFNFHIEFNAILTIPIPHFYAYHSAKPKMMHIEVGDFKPVAIYSISPIEIKDTDENGWGLAAVTEYATDKGETFVDLSRIFEGNDTLGKAIRHTLSLGVSPYKFVNIKMYYNEDIAKTCSFKFDWDTKIATFDKPANKEILSIAIYYDKVYMNTLEIEAKKYNNSRISSD